MTELTGALACLFALLFLVGAIWIAVKSKQTEQAEDEYLYPPELRFTSQGRVLRVEHYDENEV